MKGEIAPVDLVSVAAPLVPICEARRDAVDANGFGMPT